MTIEFLPLSAAGEKARANMESAVRALMVEFPPAITEFVWRAIASRYPFEPFSGKTIKLPTELAPYAADFFVLLEEREQAKNIEILKALAGLALDIYTAKNTKTRMAMHGAPVRIILPIDTDPDSAKGASGGDKA